MGKKSGDAVSDFAILEEENENPVTKAQVQSSNRSPKAAKITGVIIAVILLVIIVSLVGQKGTKNESNNAKLNTAGNRDNLRQDNGNSTSPNETTAAEFDAFTATISATLANKTETTTAEFDAFNATISATRPNTTETTTAEFDAFNATISATRLNKTETTTEFNAFTATISATLPNTTETTTELDTFTTIETKPYLPKYPQPIMKVYPLQNYIIMSNVDGTVLDVEHSSHEVGANLDLWPYIHGRNQIFKFMPAMYVDQFFILNKNSELIIGVSEEKRIVQLRYYSRYMWSLQNDTGVEGVVKIYRKSYGKETVKCLGNVRSPVAGLMMSNSLQFVNCDVGEETYFRLISVCDEN